MRCKPRCLLVDDEPKSARVFEKTVRSLGHDCDMATNQERALALLRKRNGKPYSYVLLDLKLKLDDGDPEPDSSVGLALLKRIREEHSKETLPILVMTAYDKDPDTVGDVYKSGANDFVVKGCPTKDLLKRISNLTLAPAATLHEKGNRMDDEPAKTDYLLEIFEDRPNVMFYKGHRISLSKMQHKFMLYLAARPSRELHTDTIIAGVWEDNPPESGRINGIRDEINKKIKKVDRKFKGADFIQALHGSGWRLNIPASKVNTGKSHR